MTKEEHLKAKGITEATGFHSYGYLYKSILEAMDSYATDRLDSYKESLRSAIEERLVMLRLSPEVNAIEIKACEYFIEKMELVTPKE